MHAQQPCVAVVAGPGTGKTKTLVARIAWLIEQQGVRPEEITAVTFTNQAAAEMRQRLCKQLGGRRAAARLTIGTFHAICLGLLGDVRLVSRGEALELAADVLQEERPENKPGGAAAGGIPHQKRRCAGGGRHLPGSCLRPIRAGCSGLGVLDFDDLLTRGAAAGRGGQSSCFTPPAGG